MADLTAEQQTEYDKLHKELVAQGGPTKGKLKAAGYRDPDGVARLAELGWVNPEEAGEATGGEKPPLRCIELAELKERGKAVGVSDEQLALYKEEHIDTLRSDIEGAEALTVETELETATKEAEVAQIAADEAIANAADKAKVAESKKPAPCWRCGGDGEWHSTKTGVRAKTSSEPLHDASRVCPECK